MQHKIAVIGDGGWGTTIAILLSEKGYDVTLWSAFPEYASFLNKTRINEKFLPGINIPGSMHIVSDERGLSGHDIFVLAVPTKYLRDTLKNLKSVLKGKIVSLTKGIEIDTLKRPSEIIREITGSEQVAVLSGPSISFEVARKMPTTVVAASRRRILAKEVQDIFSTPDFRIYTSSDVTGVELGGAIKNVIAIAAGISDGIGFGVNTKAAILTRGLVEIIRLGSRMGAKKETFFGLSGMGDLATTCMSGHSRNRAFGERIAKGENFNELLKNGGMIVEGVTTAKAAFFLSRRFKIEMPITAEIYKVIYEGKNPKEAVSALMTRALKAEDA